MNLTFIEIRVENFSFMKSSGIEKNAFDFGFSPRFKEGDAKDFIVSFEVKMEVFESQSVLETEIFGIFETEAEISEDFKNSTFPKINAPAIAYPFVRAFLSNFLLSAGHTPIKLPSINFSSIVNKEK
ncbi:MAG: preprotein translocase subunit SecB [Candidatus Cloacimonadota bacterium]|nr:MAG: preprotein translocase subunit SecB [Candidatus Cloacimonadota bacterium]